MATGFLIVLSIILSFRALCQTASCSNLKNGTFYLYPKNSDEACKIIRNGAKETEIDLRTGDTSAWKINWQKDCQYKLKYISGGNFQKTALDVLKKHEMVFSVERNDSNYYVADYYLDKKSKLPFLTDTIWKTERHMADRTFFTELQPLQARRLRMKDTSQYALLYVYRSGKVIGMAVDLLLKCEGVTMSNMSNKSAYDFKILKEGELNFLAQTVYAEDIAQIDFEFGNKYYLDCGIKISMKGGKPVLNVVDAGKGENGFWAAQ